MITIFERFVLDGAILSSVTEKWDIRGAIVQLELPETQRSCFNKRSNKGPKDVQVLISTVTQGTIAVIADASRTQKAIRFAAALSKAAGTVSSQ